MLSYGKIVNIENKYFLSGFYNKNNNNNNLFTLSYSISWFASSTIVATCNVLFPNVQKRRNIIRFHLSTVVVDVLVKLLLLISIDCSLVNTLKVAPLNSCTKQKKIQTKGTVKSH